MSKAKKAIRPGTTEILFNTAERPLHLRPASQLDSEPVSTRSVWSDSRWILDNDTHGATLTQSSISWDLQLPDGFNLLHPKHAKLLDWLRRLVWAVFAAPGDGARVRKPGSLGVISAGIRFWAAWLVGQHIAWPAEITGSVVKKYIDDLRALADDDSEAPSLTEAVAYCRLSPFVLLWRQRFTLEKAGIPPMPDPPFGRRGAIKVAREIAAIAKGSFRSLPDEVALPILNKAMWMIGVPAQDVVALVDACETAYSVAVKSRSTTSAHKRLSEAVRAFCFSAIDGEVWHPPLNPADWDKNKLAGIEAGVRAYLQARSSEWAEKVERERRPTLPSIYEEGHGTVLDLRLVILAVGFNVGDELYIRGNRQLHKLIDEAAREQGFPAVPFIIPIQKVRGLVAAVQSAAHIVIQATTGMRISEICGLKAGLNPETGLPRSLEIRDSLSGLGEVFVLTSDLSKTEETPRPVEWTLGYRPKGSSHVPPAVEAMLVLNRLLAPYRHLLGTDDLFVGLTAHGLPRTRAGVTRVRSDYMRQRAKSFVAEWVDLTNLPDEAARKTMEKELVPYRESHGRIVKTHQWRKAFANFAYRVDARLLPVLQMHYHHVSISMTDGYVGNSILAEDRNDIVKQHTALLSLEIARGETSIAGRYGEVIEQTVRDELGQRLRDLPADEAYREAFIYIEEAGLDRLFFEPHGICGARSASQMACHSEAGTVQLARWNRRLSPNYETRTPGLCAGCESFAVARNHAPFWEERYVEHMVSLEQLKAGRLGGLNLENSSALTLARARQAQALCRKLGSSPKHLEQRVADRLREHLNAT